MKARRRHKGGEVKEAKGQMKVSSAFHNKYPFSQYYPVFFKFSDYLLRYEQEQFTSLDTKARSHAPEAYNISSSLPGSPPHEASH